jgi:hypothetical protein
MLGSVLLFVCLCGCQKTTEPKDERFSAGPYPECRSIREWLRIKHDDPETDVIRWGSRTEESEVGSVLIEVHFQATIGKVPDGHWVQTLRVIDRNNIMEETQPVAEE